MKINEELELLRELCRIDTTNYTHMQNHNDDTIKTSRHSSWEKFTSHFIERVVCERELKTEQNCSILTPTLLAITVFLSRSPVLGHGSHSSIFSPTDLDFLSPGLCNNLMSTYFQRASQFALSSTPRQSRSPPDIFDRMHLLFTQVHFFFGQLGWVGGQYATTW